MHAVIAGIIEIDADRLLDDRHGGLVLAAIPDIEEFLAREVFLEEAAVDASLIAACRLRPDVSHHAPRNTKSAAARSRHSCRPCCAFRVLTIAPSWEHRASELRRNGQALNRALQTLCIFTLVFTTHNPDAVEVSQRDRYHRSAH